MDQSLERWLPIAGWEGLYEVSDQGRVRSLDRTVPTRKGLRKMYGRVLQSKAAAGGHPHVKLHSNSNKPVCRAVDLLVMEAFIGQRPNGSARCHVNGEPGDCRLVNLVYLPFKTST